MKNRRARVRSDEGWWLQDMLTAHARAVSRGTLDSLIDLSEAAATGAIVVAEAGEDICGYAAVQGEGSPSREWVQMHVLGGEGDHTYNEILAVVSELLGGHSVEISPRLLAPHVVDALDRLGPDYGVLVSDESSPGLGAFTPSKILRLRSQLDSNE